MLRETSVVGDVRRLLQDTTTPDIKALTMEMSHFKERRTLVEEQLRRMDQKLDDRCDRIINARDVRKDGQELKEFRIRMEERGKLSA